MCYITYAYNEPITLVNIVLHLNKMVKTRRLEFVAKQARDFVLSIQDRCLKDRLSIPGCLRYMSQVDVAGYSFGAHVGKKFCDYIFQKTNEKVNMLLGTVKLHILK